MVRVGDKIKLLRDIHTLPPKGSTVVIISMKNTVSQNYYILGLVCNYPNYPRVASGEQPNWWLQLGEDFIVMPRKKYPKRPMAID